MQDLRQYLTNKANQIVKASLNGQGSLTELNIKVAKEDKLNDTTIRTLSGITNQQYIALTNQHEFEPCNADQVFAGLYGAPEVVEKVAYEYPEYYPSVNKQNTKPEEVITEKVASSHPVDVSRMMKDFFVKDEYALRVERAKLHNDCEKYFHKSASIADALKLHGYTNRKLRDSLFTQGFKEASVLNFSEKLLTDSKQLPAGLSIKSANYNTEGMVKELGEASREFLSKYASFAEIDTNYKERMKWRNSIYNMGPLYV